MSMWETKTVSDVVNKISGHDYVLPVIQRRLVWDEDKMELLFDTLLKGNSFGGIMVLEEEKGSKPLFAYRYFTKDGYEVKSVEMDTRLLQEQYFVIDGQQRLQSFFIGLTGSINGKTLYFNLNSDRKKLVFDFEFSDNITKKLPQKENNDDEGIKEYVWYSAKQIYQRAKEIRDVEQLQDEITINLKIQQESLKENVKANIQRFYNSVFSNPSIGMSKVTINKTHSEIDNKQRIVELFRRLNDGGTKLSSFELVASILKGFSWKMESFLDDVVVSYKDIGIGQDELIKLIFILQDDHKKEMANVSAEDATFAIENRERIESTLKALNNFLHMSNLHDYYTEGGRSVIPLYFIAYHIFHQEVEDKDLASIFDRSDVKSEGFNKIYRWMYISLLNGVFKRGAGWIPYKAGIRKILDTMKHFKKKDFPEKEIYLVYKQHPLRFFSSHIHEDDLDRLDRSVIFYIINNCSKTLGQRDVDHIHPKSILEVKNVPPDKINSIANLQLLHSKDNRDEKRAKEFTDWIIEYVENKEDFLERYCIPDNPRLWDSNNFEAFLAERRKLILSKIRNCFSKCSTHTQLNEM